MSYIKQKNSRMWGWGSFYDRTETWIPSEKMHEVLYSFEMEAYIMAYHADSTIPNDINDLLE